MRLLSAVLVSAVVTAGLIARRRSPRLSIEPFPSVARAAVAVVLLVGVLAVTVFLPLQGIFGESAPPDLENASFLSLFAGHVVLGGFLLVWWGLAGFVAPERFLRLSLQRPARRVWFGFGAGLAGWMATIAAMAAAAYFLGLGERAAGMSGGGDAAAGVGEIPDVVRFLVGLPVWRRLLLVISAGVFEEAFFRSFLQPRAGLFLSTLLFTMSHASYGMPFMLIGVFTVSLVLGLLFRASDDVLPCMVAHSVFDGVQLLVVLPFVVSSQ
ncbi:MAG TPA: CPBP family intramembrane glutamic endopeptidase [Candidatus Binatia bacterium]|nr:CPBP family intramembrane glutamic endopeptidase [Candidatus Binatia bacterium]